MLNLTELFQLCRLVLEEKNVVPLKEVRLVAPIMSPDKIACVGLNYRGHCEEQNLPLPPEPIIFSKFSSTITGPYDNIKLPAPVISNVSILQ